ncbi:MAG TPA: lipid asymmetry maintenance ABC transporter permease subunit MlaE [Candidatus Azoamicus sp.]
MKKIFFIINKIEFLGLKILDFIFIIGKSVLLLKYLIFSNLDFNKNFKAFLRHLYFIGFLSLGIIVLSALFIGMVVGLQGHYILQKFGTEEIIGQMSALTIIRELGPVVSALLFTGRTGASLTAEICLMKSTEQLLAMEMMGVDVIKKVVAPRFWAGLISMVLLSLIFIVVAIFGSYLSTVCWLNLDNDIFWMSIRENVDFKIDIVNSIIKSFIFGIIITWISIFQGVDSKSTAEGIALSTTNTVVYSSFIILGLNFFLTSIMFKWI